MKVKFKSLVAAAAFMTAGLASAATVTVTAGTTAYKGVTLSGSETLTLSKQTLTAFNAFETDIIHEGVGTTVSTKDPVRSFWTDSTTLVPLSVLQIENTTDQVQSAASSGGLRLVTPDTGLVKGGTLNVTNLEVDLLNKRVYATLVGGNGVGTLQHFHLFDIATVTGTTTVLPAPTAPAVSNSFTASGLQLTAASLPVIVSAMGLDSSVTGLGTQILKSVTDFGTLKVDTSPTVVKTCSVTFKTTPKAKGSLLTNNEVTIQNLGSNPATGWLVNWAYTELNLVTSVKNAKLSNKYLKAYTAQPVTANKTLTAGGATTFSFVASSRSGNSVPTGATATLGGQACVVNAQ